MQFYPAAWLKLIVPAVLIAAGYWGRAALESFSVDTQIFLRNMPYLLALLSLLMAYQFNRSRLLLATLFVVGFYWLVQNQLQVSLEDPAAARTFLSLSLVLPVFFLMLFLLPERGVLHPVSAVAFLGVAVLVLLVYWMAPWLGEANAGAVAYYAPWPGEQYVLSYGASLLCLFVALVGVCALALRHEESEAALLGAFVALYLALAKLHYESVSTALCTAAGLCMLWGVLRSSHAMAYRDDLTGLPGRRALNERLKLLGRRFTIAMIDVDHFKRFNDKHGHDVGDDVLRLVASRIRRVGGGGTAYRYGGEEFCVVFPRRSVEECLDPMEEVREEIAHYKMSLRDSSLRPKRKREGARRRGATRIKNDELRVTISIGLAERGEGNLDPDAVVKAADKKLFQAKRKGRNRVQS